PFARHRSFGCGARHRTPPRGFCRSPAHADYGPAPRLADARRRRPGRTRDGGRICLSLALDQGLDTTMSQKILTAYLNDHVAGSVAALELLDHVIQLQHGTPLASTLAGLRAEIEEDQTVLQGLLHGVGGSESRLRHAAV